MCRLPAQSGCVNSQQPTDPKQGEDNFLEAAWKRAPNPDSAVGQVHSCMGTQPLFGGHAVLTVIVQAAEL
jgi:hypothetical protein